MRTTKDRAGEKGHNKQGYKMWILKYESANDITVQFESGYLVSSKYVNFITGNIKDPYSKSVYGKGYLGEGKYKASENGKNTKAYAAWNSMLQRCYDKSTSYNLESYVGCTVCDEWLNFQSFAKWYYDNHYKVKNKKLHLDKDIKYDGNKIYSPWTCLLVPSDINLMFRKNTNPSRSKIRNIAESYKGVIPNELYEILYNK